MIDTLQAIADGEKDATRKSRSSSSRWRSSIASRRRPVTGAVELFSEALDLNPQYLEAFERINKLLTARKDWKSLERCVPEDYSVACRRRTSRTPELEFSLWHNLGPRFYRDRLKDTASAIEAFKIATRFKEDEVVERQILAELYEATDQTESAVGEHSLVLQKDPLRVDPYRNLYKLLSSHAHEYDPARVVHVRRPRVPAKDGRRGAALLRGLPPGKGMIQVKSRMDNEGWVKGLFHKDENLFIGKIFEMLTPAAIVAKTNQLRAQKQLPVLGQAVPAEPCDGNT